MAGGKVARSLRLRLLVAVALALLGSAIGGAATSASGPTIWGASGMASLTAGVMAVSVAAPQPLERPIPGSQCAVYPADNIWNTDISHMPVHAKSGEWLATMQSNSTLLHPDFGAPPYGMPFAVVGDSYPKVSIDIVYAGESDPGPQQRSHLRPGLQCPSPRYVDLGRRGRSLDPRWARPLRRGQGWPHRSRDQVHGRAHRLQSHLAGAARRRDVRLRVPTMGARFRLKTSFSLAGFSRPARVILRAMKRYGLLLADNGTNWYFQGTEDSRWSDQLLDQLKTVPASAFEVVDESACMVDQDSGQAVCP
jgi:hypothetical protein